MRNPSQIAEMLANKKAVEGYWDEYRLDREGAWDPSDHALSESFPPFAVRSVAEQPWLYPSDIVEVVMAQVKSNGGRGLTSYLASLPRILTVIPSTGDEMLRDDLGASSVVRKTENYHIIDETQFLVDEGLYGQQIALPKIEE